MCYVMNRIDYEGLTIDDVLSVIVRPQNFLVNCRNIIYKHYKYANINYHGASFSAG